MTLLGLIALITGVLGVLLTIKQSVWCWPAALISVITSSIEFYEQRLFGDMALQVFYFISGLYGWYYWGKNKADTFSVTRTPSSKWLILIGATALQFIVYYFLLQKFKGDKVLIDALLTAASITATFMMTKKWLENWLAWVLIDLTYVFLYGVKNMWLFAVLYLVFTIMAAYGYLQWKKKGS